MEAERRGREWGLLFAFSGEKIDSITQERSSYNIILIIIWGFIDQQAYPTEQKAK